jgi:hypothetical protein
MMMQDETDYVRLHHEMIAQRTAQYARERHQREFATFVIKCTIAAVALACALLYAHACKANELSPDTASALAKASNDVVQAQAADAACWTPRECAATRYLLFAAQDELQAARRLAHREASTSEPFTDMSVGPQPASPAEILEGCAVAAIFVLEGMLEQLSAP